MAAPLLTHAANGRNWLTFEVSDAAKWRMAREWLTRAGFVETGDAVLGLDEGILPSLVRGDVTVAAGFDHWSGSYLLAQCDKGDQVVADLAAHVAAKDCRRPA